MRLHFAARSASADRSASLRDATNAESGGTRTIPLAHSHSAAKAGPTLRIVVLLALGAASLFAARSLTLDHDIARMMPDRDPGLARAQEFVQHLMARALVELSVPASDPSRLARAADRLSDRLAASPSVRRAGPSFEAETALGVIEVLRDRAARLVTPSGLEAALERTSPQAMAQRIREVERGLHAPDGAALLDRFAEDPLGLSDLALAPLERLAEAFGDSRLVDGYVVDAAGERLLLFVEPATPPTDTAATRAFLADLDTSIRDLRETAEFSDVTVRHLGAHRATLDNAEQIERDVQLTGVVGAVGIVIVAALTFARFFAVFLALLPALFGGSVALGVHALFRDDIAAAVAGFGAVLLAITIDYAIHIVFRMERVGARPPRRALVIGASTTAAAFLALLASSLPGIREVGLFGAVGTAAACGFAVVVLPGILGRKTPTRSPWIDLRAIVARVGRSRLRWLAPIGLLVVTPVLAFGIRQLRLDGDPRGLSSLSESAAADEHAIESAWGSVFRVTSVVVTAPTLDDALALNEAVTATLDVACADGEASGHASVAALLPSLATQEARWRAWREVFDVERRRQLEQNFAAAIAGSAFEPAAFAGWVDALQREPPPLDTRTLETTPLGRLAADRVFATDRGVTVATPVFTRGIEQVRRLADRLDAAHGGRVTVVDRGLLVRQLAEIVTAEARWIGLFAFLAVLAIVSLWWGRVELVVVAAVPLVLSGVWTLGLLGWCGVPVTLANSVFLAFLFGLAIDYAIFIAHSRIERFRGEGDHTADADASVVFCAVTTGIGFGALALAGHPVLFSIGSTAAIGIACAALATLTFVPFGCALVMRRPGPYGSFHWRYLWPSARLFVALIGRAVRYFIRNAFTLDPAVKEQRALSCIRSGAEWVRDRMPIGRRVHIGGLEACAPAGIVVANHESHYDNVALSALGAPLVFLIKPWVSRLPLVGALVRHAGYRIVREGDAEALLTDVERCLARGVSVLSYPEGTRTRTGRIGRFHNGAFRLARELEVAVTPVVLVNTRSAVHQGTWWVGEHDARVIVLDPVDPRDYVGEFADRRMARSVRDTIQRTRDDHWIETQMGPRWWQPLAVSYRYLGRRYGRRARRRLQRDPLLFELPRCLIGEGPILFVGVETGAYLLRCTMAFPERAFTVLETDPRKVRLARALIGPNANVTFLAELATLNEQNSSHDARADTARSSGGADPSPKFEHILLVDGPPAEHRTSASPLPRMLAALRAEQGQVWFPHHSAGGFRCDGDWTILAPDASNPQTHAMQSPLRND